MILVLVVVPDARLAQNGLHLYIARQHEFHKTKQNVFQKFPTIFVAHLGQVQSRVEHGFDRLDDVGLDSRRLVHARHVRVEDLEHVLN